MTFFVGLVPDFENQCAQAPIKSLMGTNNIFCSIYFSKMPKFFLKNRVFLEKCVNKRAIKSEIDLFWG